MPKLKPDEKWKRFNQELVKLMREGDFFGLGTKYYEMADFLEKEGKDNRHLRKAGYQMKLRFQTEELNRIAGSGVVESVEILATSDSCGTCKKLNGKVLSIQEARQKNPIPVEECTHKYGCRCTYLPVVK